MEETLRDVRGREVRPRSPRQAAKIGALQRTNPDRLLFLGQDEDGTVHFSLRLTYRHGHPRGPEAGAVSSDGELRWLRPD